MNLVRDRPIDDGNGYQALSRLIVCFLNGLCHVLSLGDTHADLSFAVADDYRGTEAEPLAALGNAGHAGDVQCFLLILGFFLIPSLTSASAGPKTARAPAALPAETERPRRPLRGRYHDLGGRWLWCWCYL